MIAPEGSGAAQARFLRGSTMGHVARMALAGTAGIGFIFLVDAANLFWLARFGTETMVAAIGYAFAIQYFSVSGAIGLMIASTVIVARSLGAGDRETARRQAGAAAAISGAVMCGVAILVVALRHELVTLAGGSGEAADLAARYLLISVPSLGVMAVAMVANGVLRADGDARRSLWVALSTGCVSLVVDPPLIYWLGIDGAAIGIAIFRVAMLAIAFRFAIGVRDLVAFPDWTSIRGFLRPFLGIAGPAALAQMATPTGNYLMTGLVSRFGDDAVAGWAVAGRISVLVLGGVFSLSSAISAILGQNLGAGSGARLRATYRDALVLGVGYAILAWVATWLALPLVASGFGLRGDGAEIVRAFVAAGAGGLPFAAALFVAIGAFNALGRPGRSTLVTWIRDGILTLPLAIWGATALGSAGAIYGQVLAGAAVGLVAGALGWAHVARVARDVERDVSRRPGAELPNAPVQAPVPGSSLAAVRPSTPVGATGLGGGEGMTAAGASWPERNGTGEGRFPPESVPARAWGRAR